MATRNGIANRTAMQLEVLDIAASGLSAAYLASGHIGVVHFEHTWALHSELKTQLFHNTINIQQLSARLVYFID